MPIEIRELHIKAVIDTGGSSKKAVQTNETSNRPVAGGADQSPELLIDLCVEKVMEILKEREER
ncbi:MAG TPA: DUF5908 family protein [Chitinophagaceae bacterium]|jgi:hypothetical protein|nr:DUF5908 family protein [Chitinophagaceae bacterium]